MSTLPPPVSQVSKKKAAEAMVKLLRELAAGQQDDTLEEPVSRRRLGLKKKRQNLIKVQKGNTDYGQGINPISRLIQIQQAKREKEPTFALLTERGLPRRREFVMQVYRLSTLRMFFHGCICGGVCKIKNP